MIGLFDRDVFYKLAVCNLWEPCLDVFGIDEPYRLVATSREVSNRRVLEKKLSGERLATALRLLENVVDKVPLLSDDLVSDILESEFFQNLNGIDAINDGEHLLVSILLRSPDRKVMITGDRKFQESMKLNKPEYWDLVGHSIINFERCLLEIHAKFGFDYLKDRAFEMRDYDGALRNCFSDGNNERAFLEGLISYSTIR